MLFDPENYNFCDCQGNRIAYQRSGKGEPVLMIHGITTYSFIWRKLIEHFKDKYDLIRIDLLGCGRSDMSVDFDLSLKNHANIILDFITIMGLGKAHLVGHDLGGGISQILAVTHPEKLLSVSLLNPVGYNYWPVQPITSMRTPVFRQLAMAAFDMGYYRTIVKKAIFNKENQTQELMDLFWSNFDNPKSKKSFLRFAKCLNNNDLLEIANGLKVLKLPVLILRAEADVFLSADITSRLHDEIPGSRLEIIAKTGHYMQEDAPFEIAGLLMEFWKSI